MIYVLMIFIGITIGLVIGKLIDIRKTDIDKEFLELIDKVILEEKKEEVKKNELKSGMRKF